MAARVGFEPTTFRTKGNESTNESLAPHDCCKLHITVIHAYVAQWIMTEVTYNNSMFVISIINIRSIEMCGFCSSIIDELLPSLPVVYISYRKQRYRPATNIWNHGLLHIIRNDEAHICNICLYRSHL